MSRACAGTLLAMSEADSTSRYSYGVVILVIDEGRKFWNRAHPDSALAKVAW